MRGVGLYLTTLVEVLWEWFRAGFGFLARLSAAAVAFVLVTGAVSYWLEQWWGFESMPAPMIVGALVAVVAAIGARRALKRLERWAFGKSIR